MGLKEFAKDELERAGFFDKDGLYGSMLGEAVMRMIEVFAAEGHSGLRASIALSAFERVARFEPLTPLTGDDDEWVERTERFEAVPLTEPDDAAKEVIAAINEPRVERLWQNKRCPRVFKREDGTAYDIEGRIFREPGGACFTSRDSRVPVTFPYKPKREYVDVPARV